MSRLSLLALALLTPALTAQNYFVCDQPNVRLRPGQSTCVTVRTSPPTPGVTIQPQFNATYVQVTPRGSGTTGASGVVVFDVAFARVNLGGTTVFFNDPTTVFLNTSTDVVCDWDELWLQGEAGSYPGALSLELQLSRPAQPGQLAAIFLSPTFGTVPLSPFNFMDPRSLSVGPVGMTVPIGFGGFASAGSPTFSAPSLTLGPATGNATIFAQGAIIDFGNWPIFRSISQPQPIYLAPAVSFSTRFQQMTNVRSFFPVIETGDQRFLAIGGGAGGIFSQIATDLCDVYDPYTDTWAPNATSMTAPRSIHTATRLQNGKWLIVGGVDGLNDPQSSAELYDPATDVFTPVGSMSAVRVGHSATLLPNGQVLIAGGLSVISTNVILTVASALNTAELFTLDPSGCNGSFTPVASAMGAPRAGHSAVLLSDGRVLLAGGLGVLGIVKTTEFFGGGGFAPGPAMPTERALASLVQIDSSPDRYLVAGGLNNLIGNGAPTDRADVYTAVPGQPGSWARAGNMSTVRGIQHAYRFGDEVIQIGGLKGDLVNPESLKSTDVYHIPSGTWSAGPNLTTERGAYGSYLDPYGVVHIMGGATGPGISPSVSDSTEWYHR